MRWILLAALALGATGCIDALEPEVGPPRVDRCSDEDRDPDRTVSFRADVQPLLDEYCYRCHSAQEPRLRGGLKLDTRDALRKGGDSGPALAPGNVKDSLLLQALRYEGLQMPPSGKLPAHVIADFEQWVAMGAPDPRTEKVVAGGAAPFPAQR